MPDDPLRDALLKQATDTDAAQARAAAKALPAPPDPELEALFRGFASRMPESWARPFVTLERVEYQEVTPYGFLNRKQHVWPKIRWDPTVVARGWALQQVGSNVNLGGTWDKVQEQVYGKHVLAISTDGEPYLAVQDDTGRLIVGGDWVIYGMTEGSRAQAMRSVTLGPPKGPDLRHAIVGGLRLDHAYWPETSPPVFHQPTPMSGGQYRAATDGRAGLPRYLARAMAELLYSAGVRD